MAQQQKRTKKLLYIFLTLFLVAAITSVVLVVREMNFRYDNAEKYKESVQSTVSVPEKEEVKLEEPSLYVDFETLQGENSDIYAWIDIPETNVSYPMLRSEEEDFYLNHNADKQQSVYGAIYTQSFNSDDFSDFNTIIYGHNMRNGTMFGSLKKYKNQEYFDSHSYINIYTPEKEYNYRVFAAYTFDDRHILYHFDFSDTEVRKEYINEVLSGKYQGIFNRDVSIGENDKVITLSTCTSDGKNRFLVQAVLIDEKQIG